LSNISILNNNLGKPYVVINFDKNTWCAYHKNTCIEVSLSDERQYAIAFAIVTAKPM